MKLTKLAAAILVFIPFTQSVIPLRGGSAIAADRNPNLNIVFPRTHVLPR